MALTGLPPYLEAVQGARLQNLALTGANVEVLIQIFRDREAELSALLRRRAGGPATRALRNQVREIADELSRQVGTATGRFVVESARDAALIQGQATARLLADNGAPADLARRVAAQMEASGLLAAQALIARPELSSTFRSVERQFAGDLDRMLFRAAATGRSVDSLEREIRSYMIGAESIPPELLADRRRISAKTLNEYMGYENPTPQDVLRVKREAGRVVKRSALIARHEMVNAHHEVTAKLNAQSPLVKAVRWNLSSRHPEPDGCDVFADEDLYGLGPGIFPKTRVPSLLHPRCLCFQTVELVKDLSEAPLQGNLKPIGPHLEPLAPSKQREIMRALIVGESRPALLAPEEVQRGMARRVLESAGISAELASSAVAVKKAADVTGFLAGVATNLVIRPLTIGSFIAEEILEEVALAALFLENPVAAAGILFAIGRAAVAETGAIIREVVNFPTTGFSGFTLGEGGNIFDGVARTLDPASQRTIVHLEEEFGPLAAPKPIPKMVPGDLNANLALVEEWSQRQAVEWAFLFDKNGTLDGYAQGTRKSVKLPNPVNELRGKTLTHNHPTPDVEVPLSPEDLYVFLYGGLEEIRAPSRRFVHFANADNQLDHYSYDARQRIVDDGHVSFDDGEPWAVFLKKAEGRATRELEANHVVLDDVEYDGLLRDLQADIDSRPSPKPIERPKIASIRNRRTKERVEGVFHAAAFDKAGLLDEMIASPGAQGGDIYVAKNGDIWDQGFTTDRDRFVTRAEAEAMVEDVYGDRLDDDGLHASDLEVIAQARLDELKSAAVCVPGKGGICTYDAEELINTLGTGRVVGLSSADVPAGRPQPEIFAETGVSGHDFALVDDRYLVDPWALGAADGGKGLPGHPGVFDLNDPVSLAEVTRLYGDPKWWSDIDLPLPERPIPSFEFKGREAINKTGYVGSVETIDGKIYFNAEGVITEIPLSAVISRTQGNHMGIPRVSAEMADAFGIRLDKVPLRLADAPVSEVQRVQAAALILTDERIFEGTDHLDAQVQARKHGINQAQLDTREEGFVSNTGLFLTRREGSALGRRRGQLGFDQIAAGDIAEDFFPEELLVREATQGLTQKQRQALTGARRAKAAEPFQRPLKRGESPQGEISASVPFTPPLHDVAAQSLGMDPQLIEGINLLAEEAAFIHAVSTKGARVILRDGTEGLVEIPIILREHGLLPRVNTRVGVEADFTDQFGDVTKDAVRFYEMWDLKAVDPAPRKGLLTLREDRDPVAYRWDDEGHAFDAANDIESLSAGVKEEWGTDYVPFESTVNAVERVYSDPKLWDDLRKIQEVRYRVHEHLLSATMLARGGPTIAEASRGTWGHDIPAYAWGFSNLDDAVRSSIKARISQTTAAQVVQQVWARTFDDPFNLKALLALDRNAYGRFIAELDEISSALQDADFDASRGVSNGRAAMLEQIFGLPYSRREVPWQAAQDFEKAFPVQGFWWLAPGNMAVSAVGTLTVGSRMQGDHVLKRLVRKEFPTNHWGDPSRKFRSEFMERFRQIMGVPSSKLLSFEKITIQDFEEVEIRRFIEEIVSRREPGSKVPAVLDQTAATEIDDFLKLIAGGDYRLHISPSADDVLGGLLDTTDSRREWLRQQIAFFRDAPGGLEIIVENIWGGVVDRPPMTRGLRAAVQNVFSGADESLSALLRSPLARASMIRAHLELAGDVNPIMALSIYGTNAAGTPAGSRTVAITTEMSKLLDPPNTLDQLLLWHTENIAKAPAIKRAHTTDSPNSVTIDLDSTIDDVNDVARGLATLTADIDAVVRDTGHEFDAGRAHVETLVAEIDSTFQAQQSVRIGEPFAFAEGRMPSPPVFDEIDRILELEADDLLAEGEDVKELLAQIGIALDNRIAFKESDLFTDRIAEIEEIVELYREKLDLSPVSERIGDPELVDRKGRAPEWMDVNELINRGLAAYDKAADAALAHTLGDGRRITDYFGPLQDASARNINAIDSLHVYIPDEYRPLVNVLLQAHVRGVDFGASTGRVLELAIQERLPLMLTTRAQELADMVRPTVREVDGLAAQIREVVTITSLSEEPIPVQGTGDAEGITFLVRGLDEAVALTTLDEIDRIAEFSTSAAGLEDVAGAVVTQWAHTSGNDNRSTIIQMRLREMLPGMADALYPGIADDWRLDESPVAHLMGKSPDNFWWAVKEADDLISGQRENMIDDFAAEVTGSSDVLFDWVEANDPDFYERVKQGRVSEMGTLQRNLFQRALSTSVTLDDFVSLYEEARFTLNPARLVKRFHQTPFIKVPRIAGPGSGLQSLPLAQGRGLIGVDPDGNQFESFTLLDGGGETVVKVKVLVEEFGGQELKMEGPTVVQPLKAPDRTEYTIVEISVVQQRGTLTMIADEQSFTPDARDDITNAHLRETQLLIAADGVQNVAHQVARINGGTLKVAARAIDPELDLSIGEARGQATAADLNDLLVDRFNTQGIDFKVDENLVLRAGDVDPEDGIVSALVRINDDIAPGSFPPPLSERRMIHFREIAEALTGRTPANESIAATFFQDPDDPVARVLRRDAIRNRMIVDGDGDPMEGPTEQDRDESLWRFIVNRWFPQGVPLDLIDPSLAPVPEVATSGRVPAPLGLTLPVWLRKATRSEFLGEVTITSDANAADLEPRFFKTATTVPAEPFGEFTIHRGKTGFFTVMDGGTVVASYTGDTLVVAPAYRRLRVGEDLVLDWSIRNWVPRADDVFPRERTKAAQRIHERVFDRIQLLISERARIARTTSTTGTVLARQIPTDDLFRLVSFTGWGESRAGTLRKVRDTLDAIIVTGGPFAGLEGEHEMATWFREQLGEWVRFYGGDEDAFWARMLIADEGQFTEIRNEIETLMEFDENRFEMELRSELSAAFGDNVDSAIDEMILAMYTFTQDEVTRLFGPNPDPILLYRGWATTEEHALRIARPSGMITDTLYQPISSVSTFQTIPSGFGTGDRHISSMIYADPRRLISIGPTGFGCVREGECVLIGGVVKSVNLLGGKGVSGRVGVTGMTVRPAESAEELIYEEIFGRLLEEGSMKRVPAQRLRGVMADVGMMSPEFLRFRATQAWAGIGGPREFPEGVLVSGSLAETAARGFTQGDLTMADLVRGVGDDLVKMGERGDLPKPLADDLAALNTIEEVLDFLVTDRGLDPTSEESIAYGKIVTWFMGGYNRVSGQLSEATTAIIVRQQSLEQEGAPSQPGGSVVQQSEKWTWRFIEEMFSDKGQQFLRELGQIYTRTPNPIGDNPFLIWKEFISDFTLLARDYAELSKPEHGLLAQAIVDADDPRELFYALMEIMEQQRRPR